MFKKYKNKLFCFSPPVMFVTFVIEFVLALYTIWRYKMNTVVRITTIILIALGTFQLSEYMLCGGLGLKGIEWARLGYMSITLLPALGIHLIVTLAGKRKPLLIDLAYLTCFFFVGFYLLASTSIDIKVCEANYAVFRSVKLISTTFGVYYYFWLFVGVYLGYKWGKEDPKRRKQLWAMVVGYLVFILPTAVVNVIEPSTISGIPSIMCGFAVLFAIILSIAVAQKSCEIKHHKQR